MKKNMILFTLSLFFVVGCGDGGSSVKSVDPGKKMGGILKRAVDGLKDAEQAPFTAFCTRQIDKAMEETINATGVEIVKVVDNYFNAKGTKENIYKLASLPFIERLEGTKFDSFKK